MNFILHPRLSLGVARGTGSRVQICPDEFLFNTLRGFRPVPERRRCSQNCSWSKHPRTTNFNIAQQIGRNWLKTKAPKIGHFSQNRESALQAGGRRFESTYLHHFSLNTSTVCNELRQSEICQRCDSDANRVQPPDSPNL